MAQQWQMPNVIVNSEGYEKSFILARQDSSFVLLRSCFSRTRSSHVIVLAHLNWMKKQFNTCLQKKLKESVNKYQVKNCPEWIWFPHVIKQWNLFWPDGLKFHPAWLFRSFKLGNGSTMSDEKLVILEFRYLQNKKW